MRKIIFNYESSNKAKRLVIDRDLPLSKEILTAMLILHSANVISLNNVLNICEVACA